MDEIHGDHERAHVHPVTGEIHLADLNEIINRVKENDSLHYIIDIKLIQILDTPFYQLKYSTEHDGVRKTQLANALTGDLRGALTELEAIALAMRHFADDAQIKSVQYLINTNNHHEYRGQPLPAFAVSFNHPTNTTVYVSADLGTVQKFRNDKWRMFDFLWMLHTMDYQNRDDFSNWLLRLFSVFGLLTILSGFMLFFITTKRPRSKKAAVDLHKS